MAKRAVTPVRFGVAVAERLSAFAAASPGMSLSSAAKPAGPEAGDPFLVVTAGF
ncbi:MAG: hypothetical protein ACR2MP_13380 [Streptosporangiaceae bacterium]